MKRWRWETKTVVFCCLTRGTECFQNVQKKHWVINLTVATGQMERKWCCVNYMVFGEVTAYSCREAVALSLRVNHVIYKCQRDLFSVEQGVKKQQGSLEKRSRRSSLIRSYCMFRTTRTQNRSNHLSDKPLAPEHRFLLTLHLL